MIANHGLDLRHLRWALIAAQHRSLRKAAETLNIGQPTLSRRLRDLEARLGVVLFERSNAGTRLTASGQEFLDAAQRIMEEMGAAMERLKARSAGAAGRLTVGVHTSLSAGSLRATLIEHRRRFAEVELCLIDGASETLFANLACFNTDIAFVIETDAKWADRSLPVWSERVVVALPDAHPLSGREIVRWEDLRHEVLLLPRRGPGPELLKLLSAKIGGVESNCVRQHDVALDRLSTLVGAGWGLSLVLEGATGIVCPGITFREVHDANGPTRLSFRAHWREANRNPALKPFLDVLRERYPDFAGGAVVPVVPAAG